MARASGSSGSGSRGGRAPPRRRRAAGLTTLAAGALAAAAAALLAPRASAFLPAGVHQSAAALASRRPRQPAAGGVRGGWRGATTLHNSEAFGTNSNGNGNKPQPEGVGPEDLQHALFKDDKRRVILFDGDCGFCSEGVNLFLNMDGDPRGSFRFASLQGEVGQELLRLNGMDQKVFNTIVLVDAERIYTKSDAVLEIADKLRDPFPVLANLAKLLPREARDWAYGLVSRYRHLFGEKDACRIPSEEEMDRFLDI